MPHSLEPPDFNTAMVDMDSSMHYCQCPTLTMNSRVSTLLSHELQKDAYLLPGTIWKCRGVDALKASTSMREELNG